MVFKTHTHTHISGVRGGGVSGEFMSEDIFLFSMSFSWVATATNANSLMLLQPVQSALLHPSMLANVEYNNPPYCGLLLVHFSMSASSCNFFFRFVFF